MQYVTFENGKMEKLTYVEIDLSLWSGNDSRRKLGIVSSCYLVSSGSDLQRPG